MVRLHSLPLSAAAIFVHFIAFRLKASLAFRIELAGVYRAPAHASRTDSNIVLFGFFDSISDAFSNDPTLSNDKSLGQLEAPPGVDPGEGGSRSDADLSDVQRKWLASQRLQRDAKRESFTPRFIIGCALNCRATITYKMEAAPLLNGHTQ